MPLALFLVLSGCAHMLGTPNVTYGNAPGVMPLVQPSTDARRWYVPLDDDHILFVDSGYASTTCDDAWVEELGLEPFGHRTSGGEVGTVDIQKAVLPPFELAGHTIEDLVCSVRDLASTSSIRDPAEVRVAAVLGADVLTAFRVTLDPGAGQIILEDPDTVPPLDDKDLLRIKGASLFASRFRTPVDIDGTRTWPLFDTGATNTYVDGNSLKLEVAYVDKGVQVRATGPGGVITVDRVYFEVDRFDVGSLEVGPITLTDRDRSPFTPGLLGLDVLNRFRTELDFQTKRVKFTPVEARRNPSWASWASPSDGAVAE